MKACLKSCLLKISPESSVANEISVIIPRVFFGLTIGLSHGLSKLPINDQLLNGLMNLGFPMPTFFAWAAALSELVGGVLLAMGLLTRVASLFLSITMLVAGLVVHSADPFGVKEMSMLYLAVFLMFLIRGGGRWSLDALLFNKK